MRCSSCFFLLIHLHILLFLSLFLQIQTPRGKVVLLSHDTHQAHGDAFYAPRSTKKTSHVLECMGAHARGQINPIGTKVLLPFRPLYRGQKRCCAYMCTSDSSLLVNCANRAKEEKQFTFCLWSFFLLPLLPTLSSLKHFSHCYFIPHLSIKIPQINFRS